VNFAAGIVMANESFTGAAVAADFRRLGRLLSLGIKDSATLNMVWVDKVYGLKNADGLMVWLKANAKLNNTDRSGVDSLSTHFNINKSVIEDFVSKPGNVMATIIDFAVSSPK
jgi:hypothetical protein